MLRKSQDTVGSDIIIGAILGIGNIHAVRATKYEWVAYINAEDDPRDGIVTKQDRAHCVKKNMEGRRIYQITDDDDEVITGPTRKELIKNLKMHSPSWWIMYSVVWNRT